MNIKNGWSWIAGANITIGSGGGTGTLNLTNNGLLLLLLITEVFRDLVHSRSPGGILKLGNGGSTGSITQAIIDNGVA